MNEGYSGAYSIELRARNPIVVDATGLEAALTARLGKVRPTGDPEKGGFRLYFLEDYPVQFNEGSIPAQLALFAPGPRPPQDQQPPSIEQALQQSWSFPEARQVFGECRHSLLLANVMSSPLPHDIRRRIIANGLLALLESAAVDLIEWSPTQQMLAPAEVRRRYAAPEELANPVYGFLNVRFFRIDNDMVMDTLGLTALGLTDLQIHYRQMEPDPVAQFLYNLGAYVFEKGDVIEDGHTVEGPGGRWSCRRDVSLLEPQREVLDIDPGPPFAAGDRAS
ncbi:MAG: DUF4261 domain-containing protein [Hyphomicrobiaceae bacterium]|nr:DUF4261 domain-containing protein [Hyphomicrobiaceae bacterium]